jgi:hypothetical protein
MQKDGAGADILHFPPKESVTSVTREELRAYEAAGAEIGWREAMRDAGLALQVQARAIEAELPPGHAAFENVASLAKISAYLIACSQRFYPLG